MYISVLKVKSAISTLEAYFLTSLDHDNCFQLIKLAQDNLLHKLYSDATRHALHYFTKVIQQPQFLNLDIETLKEYLMRKELNVCSEIDVLDAISLWVEVWLVLCSFMYVVLCHSKFSFLCFKHIMALNMFMYKWVISRWPMNWNYLHVIKHIYC